MPSSRNPHPHVKWRDGRPRFEPGPALRAAGHKARDLKHDDGRWLSKGEAVDWSIRFQRELAKAAGKARTRRARPVPATRLYTVAHLFEDWFASPKFQRPADPAEALRQQHGGIVYAAKTIVDFRQKARVLESHDPSLWAAPVDALTQPVMFGLYEELRVTRGVATARGVMAVLSVALGWGRKRGKHRFRENAGVNPVRDLGMATPPPRIRFATRPEIAALVAAADALGHFEIGDSIMLGLWTGQRQGDRLALTDKGMLNGRRIFRQAKTGAIVAIRDVPDLAARLAAAADRRRAVKAEALLAATPEERRPIELRFSHVILNEQFDPRRGRERHVWEPFNEHHYRHVFAKIRDLAVRGSNKLALQPCPSLADFHEADLRDTAVTWMALAGATIPEIISVTGHSVQSATTILKHYLARHPEMADEAIRKMVAWYDAGGETEIGL